LTQNPTRTLSRKRGNFGNNLCVHPSQETCEKPDGLEVRLKVAVTDELCSWILGLGPDAEVIAPKSLRRRIAALLKENLSIYLEA